MMNQPDQRTLTRVLVEDPSHENRSRAHFELGQRAVDDNERARAVNHFREAWHLDPTDEQPLKALEAIGARLETTPPPPRRGLLPGRTWWPFSR